MTKMRNRNKAVSIFSKCVIFVVALVFALFAFHSVDPAADFGHFMRHLGVGMTIFASFMAAYDFTMFQGRYVERWFHGLNLTILILTMLFCTLAMSNDQERVLHNLYVHFSLFLYIVWDFIAINYYKRRSRSGYSSYKQLRIFDIVLFGLCFLAYMPLNAMVPSQVVQIMSETHSDHAFSDFMAGVVLIAELLAFLPYRPKINPSDAPEERIGVFDGYAAVADYYDLGNPIMAVEEKHTKARIPQLDIRDNVVDLGCGTGRYVEQLLVNAAKVYAIDSSEEMLGKLRKRITNPKLEVLTHEVDTGLKSLSRGSIHGIFCSLVIDHLSRDRLMETIKAAYDALSYGGWIYITDVNPYYEEMEHPYAEFVSTQGEGTRIVVYPHFVSEVRKHLEEAGFKNWKLTEVNVTKEDAERSNDLADLVGQPLIFEYSAVK